jgi:Ca-activated chloride channel family protein
MAQPVRIPNDEYVTLWHRMPSWVISLALHAGLLLLFMTTMRGCGGSVSGTTGEEFRSIGIYVKDAQQDQTDAEPNENESVDQSSQQVSDSTSVDEKPPAELDLPTQSRVELGAGPAPLAPNVGSGEIRQENKSGGQLIQTSLGLGKGETRFANIIAAGDRFTYVIDRSGSMMDEKIVYARAQLSSSLNVLQPYQQFQILFYNETVTKLRVPGQNREGFYAATGRNVRRALAAVSAQESVGGTKHIEALNASVQLKPDVVFFLTDGHKPVPNVGSIAALRKLNGGRSRIHCIEFGVGANTSAGTWLQKVARENGGQYKYIDDTKIR